MLRRREVVALRSGFCFVVRSMPFSTLVFQQQRLSSFCRLLMFAPLFHLFVFNHLPVLIRVLVGFVSQQRRLTRHIARRRRVVDLARLAASSL